MQTITWMGLAAGLLLVGAEVVSPPPVVRHLGPHAPTPLPTPPVVERQRVISSITVQNSPKGETTVGFEATDYLDEGEDRTRVLAAKIYSLADDRPELQPLRRRILQQLRDLEHTIQDYVEKSGPPEERAPVAPGQSGGGY